MAFFSPVWFLTVFVAFTCAVQMISIVIVVFRTQVSAPSQGPLDLRGVSIIRPICGLENNLEETLESTFLLNCPLYEIIFCVASQRDAAILLVESAMLRHPTIAASLLIGNDQISVNPKLNNMKKGWDAARYDWVVMADSNVLLPRNYLQCILSRWTPTTGLVSSPAIGTRPVGIWAEIECAFLNTYQARWQLVADQIGLGFAQGKNLCWKRQFLENAGGIRAMAAEIAEDVASTKIVRNAGLSVRLTLNPFAQPLGYRSMAEVWNRQVRWARLRRVGLKVYFIPELLNGGLLPLVAASLIVYLGGYSPSWVFVLFLAWYGTEAMLAKLADWPISLRAILAIVLRDLLLPAIWFSAWGNGTFVWHGNVMSTRKSIRSTFSTDA